MRLITTLAVSATLLLTLAACSDDNDTNVSDNNTIEQRSAEAIPATAAAAGDYSTLLTVLEATGLDAVLADESRTFTVFAPDNAAFEALGEDTINALLADTDRLREILLYHVIADTEINAAAALASVGQSVETANEASLSISQDGMTLFINQSAVTAPDVLAANGVIHGIDAVLLPPEPAATADDAPSLNLVATAQDAGSFSTLLTALDATGLTDVLNDSSRNFTVFAPTDDAFAALPEGTLDNLLANPEALQDVLLYHVIADQAVEASTAISLAGSTVDMANGDATALTLDEGSLLVNNAVVTSTDIRASNGIIHVIDSVLIPPTDTVDEPLLSDIVSTARGAGTFNTLVAALEATGLDTTLASTDSEFTVFAPTDAAFALLGDETINALLADTDKLSNILLYHVVSGARVDAVTATSLIGTDVTMANGQTVRVNSDDSGLLVNLARVTATDIAASNGVIHVIDAVLLPPMEAAEAPEKNLIDTARDAGQFSTLVAALEATGLDVAIGHGSDQYTVFAPTDAAFAALGQETIDALLADPDTLRNILLYHVIAGTRIDAETALMRTGISIEAANGQRFELNLDGDALRINDSLITATDIMASNGIIHVIDKVLLP